MNNLNKDRHKDVVISEEIRNIQKQLEDLGARTRIENLKGTTKYLDIAVILPDSLVNATPGQFPVFRGAGANHIVTKGYASRVRNGNDEICVGSDRLIQASEKLGNEPNYENYVRYLEVLKQEPGVDPSQIQNAERLLGKLEGVVFEDHLTDNIESLLRFATIERNGGYADVHATPYFSGSLDCVDAAGYASIKKVPCLIIYGLGQKNLAKIFNNGEQMIKDGVGVEYIRAVLLLSRYHNALNQYREREEQQLVAKEFEEEVSQFLKSLNFQPDALDQTMTRLKSTEHLLQEEKRLRLQKLKDQSLAEVHLTHRLLEEYRPYIGDVQIMDCIRIKQEQNNSILLPDIARTIIYTKLFDKLYDRYSKDFGEYALRYERFVENNKHSSSIPTDDDLRRIIFRLQRYEE